MRVAIFGSKDWSNYPDIIRSLTIFIQEAHEMGHDNIVFVHSGGRGAENMITEYIGKTQRFLKQKQFKIKEEVLRNDSQVLKDMAIIESGVEFALIFSTGCRRTLACKKILQEYNIPFRIVESA